MDSIIYLMALVPLLLSLLMDNLERRYLLLLRLFQLFKLFMFFAELNIMAAVFNTELRTLISAILVMFVLVFISASWFYLFESKGQADAFGSIPQSLWWAIVTLTTLERGYCSCHYGR